MIFKLFLTIACLAAFFSTFAQSQLDSLKAELPNAKSDTNHVVLLTTLAKLEAKTNPDQGLEYARQAEIICQNIDWKKGSALAYQMIGYNHSVYGRKDSSIHYYSKSNKIAELEGLYSIAGRNAYAIAVAYRDAMEYENALEYYDIAIATYDRINEKRTMAAVINNKAWLLLKVNRYNDALAAYEQLAQVSNEEGIDKGLASVVNKTT
jgi:tetratricopeptide (TPR) repeat protein